VSPPAAGPALLAARNLSIGWRARIEAPLSTAIELDLEAGELAALVGPNGSGKSTLLRTLVGLQAPLRGEAYLCGEEVGRLTVEGRSTRVACVFTDRFDAGYFSVFDIVAFGRYPYTDARNRLGPHDLAAVEGAIAAVGLSKLARRRFAELSDGERQKALVARAIAQDCPVLVLDEPTAFLDAPARVEIFHVARGLARASGKAVVLSTHDIDHALRYADKLWLMDGQHRFAAGVPEDLATSGAIGRAFDVEGFRFDARTGAFRSVEELKPERVEILGPEGASRAWTLRLAERLGLSAHGSAQGEPAPPLASIEIEEGPGGPLFTVRPSGGEAEARVAASYAELAGMLAGLAAASGAGRRD
jgi:iron complex transport system ATP-binding protein